jgi:nicotinamide riboside kinase
LYLLCNPDIKWEFDPQRENQFDRDKIFQIYKCELQTLNHDYFIIKDQDRLVQAKKIIKNFIG